MNRRDGGGSEVTPDVGALAAFVEKAWLNLLKGRPIGALAALLAATRAQLG